MNAMAKALVAALTQADIKWRDYSGRGMFGAYCVGVSCGRNHSEGEVLEAVRNVKGGLRPSRDAMGMGTIVYWPQATLGENDTGDDA
jgi:hypothetical protein